MKRTIAAVAVAAGLLLTACSSTTSTEPATEASPAAASAPASAEASMPATPGTIVDIASAGADFSTLVAALSAAGLVETLQGPGPFTVFAPTNAAFAASATSEFASQICPAF